MSVFVEKLDRLSKARIVAGRLDPEAPQTELDLEWILPILEAAIERHEAIVENGGAEVYHESGVRLFDAIESAKKKIEKD